MSICDRCPFNLPHCSLIWGRWVSDKTSTDHRVSSHQTVRSGFTVQAGGYTVGVRNIIYSGGYHDLGTRGGGINVCGGVEYWVCVGN